MLCEGYPKKRRRLKLPDPHGFMGDESGGGNFFFIRTWI